MIDSNTIEFKYFSVPRGNQIVPNFGGEKKIKKANRGQTVKCSRLLVHSSGKRIKLLSSNVEMLSSLQYKRIPIPNFLQDHSFQMVETMSRQIEVVCHFLAQLLPFHSRSVLI